MNDKDTWIWHCRTCRVKRWGTYEEAHRASLLHVMNYGHSVSGQWVRPRWWGRLLRSFT